MAEGLDLRSKSVEDKAQEKEEPSKTVETECTAQENPSVSTMKQPEGDTEEDLYLRERKRKGKANQSRAARSPAQPIQEW